MSASDLISLGIGSPAGIRAFILFGLSGSGGASDTTPDAFSFTDQSGVARSATITSAAIVVSGIDAASAITVSGGTYSINGGAYTASAGTVVNGDSITVRHTSSASYLTDTSTVLTIGGVSDTFTSTTLGDPALAAFIYRPFSFNWWFED